MGKITNIHIYNAKVKDGDAIKDIALAARNYPHAFAGLAVLGFTQDQVRAVEMAEGEIQLYEPDAPPSTPPPVVEAAPTKGTSSISRIKNGETVVNGDAAVFGGRRQYAGVYESSANTVRLQTTLKNLNTGKRVNMSFGAFPKEAKFQAAIICDLIRFSYGENKITFREFTPFYQQRAEGLRTILGTADKTGLPVGKPTQDFVDNEFAAFTAWAKDNLGYNAVEVSGIVGTQPSSERPTPDEVKSVVVNNGPAGLEWSPELAGQVMWHPQFKVYYSRYKVFKTGAYLYTGPHSTYEKAGFTCDINAVSINGKSAWDQHRIMTGTAEKQWVNTMALAK